MLLMMLLVVLMLLLMLVLRLMEGLLRLMVVVMLWAVRSGPPWGTTVVLPHLGPSVRPWVR
jgi:hypothetical protein